MAEELREVGVAIGDDELSLIALNGLDECYDPFVIVQTARVDEINFASLLGLLRSFEICLNQHTKVRGIATANSVQSSSIVLCQICDRKGHTALAFYIRHNEQCFPSKSKPRSRFIKGSKPSTPIANAVWYPNSGASDHVTSNSTLIKTTDNDQTTKVITNANGKSIPIHHTGSSDFILENKHVRLNSILLTPVKKNILSISKFCADNSVSLRFGNAK